MSELLPCPFCGGRAVLSISSQMGYQVSCENRCTVGTFWRPDRDEVFAAWNRRVPAPQASVPVVPVEVRAAMQLCAATVKLIYYRGDIGYADSDSIIAAERIERWLDSQRQGQEASSDD